MRMETVAQIDLKEYQVVLSVWTQEQLRLVDSRYDVLFQCPHLHLHRPRRCNRLLLVFLLPRLHNDLEVEVPLGRTVRPIDRHAFQVVTSATSWINLVIIEHHMRTFAIVH